MVPRAEDPFPSDTMATEKSARPGQPVRREDKSPPARPGKAEFSIDEFIGEIEKVGSRDAEQAAPQDRLRNKPALDNAARRRGADRTRRLRPGGYSAFPVTPTTMGSSRCEMVISTSSPA